MILSKSCEYAIRATVYIALKSGRGEKVGIIEVAEAIGSPMHFTGKILQTLVRKKLLTSAKGPTGGFYLENGSQLFLVDIIRAIDGNGLFSACVLGLERCSETQPCPMHEQVKPIREMLLTEFSKKPVTELVAEFGTGGYFLK
ncbi:RrF2 family transcriptional regulator [Mucilaginibacter boryungensis]|uniref:Rrf2 family transcriptional regulator n=1 Tax=Mucilaginibacter boryungensis TaxID=768480 RepID=A0ABR9XDU4_9SPHI|nr:Rrf2 family transcriptional regulator [Mucilaginibacter boryungensis]MBE9665347.1 Rrf2 family transcriptional regulator [Mucilaginibacter boryungensis]